MLSVTSSNMVETLSLVEQLFASLNGLSDRQRPQVCWAMTHSPAYCCPRMLAVGKNEIHLMIWIHLVSHPACACYFQAEELCVRYQPDTLREVPHPSNVGLALQARVSGPWPHKKESVLLVELARWQGVQVQTVRRQNVVQQYLK